MCSLLAAYEEAAFYFPRFTGKATEAYRDKQLAQVQVDCEWRCWSFSPRWCNSRDLFLAITSVQLGSSSGDPNTFSVLLIWVSHQKPQNYLWFLLRQLPKRNVRKVIIKIVYLLLLFLHFLFFFLFKWRGKMYACQAPSVAFSKFYLGGCDCLHMAAKLLKRA